MSDSGKGGGALTGQRAESLGLMLNAFFFFLAGARAESVPDARAESLADDPINREVVPAESSNALPALALSPAKVVSAARVVAESESESARAAGGVLRGTRIGRGDQSLGSTSQSCTS